MTQRYQRVAYGVFAACFATVIAFACGGDDKKEEQNVGDQGGSGGDAGAGGGSGGTETAGSAGSGDRVIRAPH